MCLFIGPASGLGGERMSCRHIVFCLGLVLSLAPAWAYAAGIAVLRDSFPPAAGHADPERLAEWLREAGHEVTLLDAGALADAGQFNADAYWLVVLPYGDCFPAAARDNFLAFLGAGGHFFSAGGYAFDSPLVQWNDRWLTRAEAVLFAPPEADIGAPGDDDFITGEWHAPETDGGASRRWTGDKAGVKLPIRAGEQYTLIVDLFASPQTEKHAKRILVNGQMALEIAGSGEKHLEAPIPPEWLANSDHATVVFDCELWCPNDFGDSPDWRRLGVKVDRIALQPTSGKSDYIDLSSFGLPINTRLGTPNDFLEWEPYQLGVFDAGFRLSGARTLEAAPDQFVMEAPPASEGPIEGWAAVGTTGSSWYWSTPHDRSRLIPLVDTQDEFGRPTGPAAAFMVNYREPYAKSLWAYAGVDNKDLFADEDGRKMLLAAVTAMQRGCFLVETRPSKACYRPGDACAVSAQAVNFGSSPAALSIRLRIEAESGEAFFEETREITLAAGATADLAFEPTEQSFNDDYYTITLDLFAGGQQIDRQRTAFYAWSDEVVATGPVTTYGDNTLRVNGASRHLLGVQAFYVQKTVTGNDPAEVERDFAAMSDLGMRLSRSFTKVKSLDFIDAMVMASQRHGVTFMLEGVADLAVEPERIAQDSAYAASISERYRGVRGLIIDIRNEPTFYPGDDGARDAAFRDYLRARYADDAALRAAWGDELGPDEGLETIKHTFPGPRWDSIRSRDSYRFMIEAQAAWADATTAAIKARRSDVPVTIGYLPWWRDMVMDAALTSDSLDFTNRHWYGPFNEIAEFDRQFVQTDRRYRGKAPSIGEFGSKTHPTFAKTNHNYDTIEQQELRYLHVGHHGLALGGIFSSNWHWRDPLSNIFPYGIAYSDYTLKPVAKAYRAMALLFSALRPRYESPPVFLVLPDESRFGGGNERIFKAVERAAGGLMDARLRFGTINEWDLARLPAGARLLVLPTPFALSDGGYGALKSFVGGGGTLYVSGDVSFDENRCRTKTDRLATLTGVKFEAERYPNVRFEDAPRVDVAYTTGIQYSGAPVLTFSAATENEVIASSAEPAPRPVAVRHSLGKGHVVFSADPAEFLDDAPLADLYRLAAETAGVEPEECAPVLPSLHVYRVPMQEGMACVVIANESDAPKEATLMLAGNQYTVDVGPYRQGMLLTDGDRLIGVETQGSVVRDGKTLLQSRSHVFARALDGKDLAEAEAVAVVALDGGKVTLAQSLGFAEAGEVRDAAWTPLSVLVPSSATVEIPESLAGDLVLVGIPSAAVEGRQRLVEALTK